MISEEKDWIVVAKSYEFLLSILRHLHMNFLLYDLFLLIESIQLFSYIYNCLYEFSDPKYDIMKIYSEISTYFRVFFIVPLDFHPD